VCALRFFYETTLGRPWMADYIAYPKKPTKLPVLLSRDEVQALRLAPRPLKPRAILATLYAPGVRVSELGQLQGTDIDSHRLVLRLRQGKGQRARFVMLSPDLLPWLRRYWKLYQLQSWLFPGYRGTEPITRMGVAHLCHQAGRMAKLTKPMDPHLLRHSFATHLRAAGVDLRRIPLLLGHARLRSPSLSLHGAHPALHATESPLDALALPAELGHRPCVRRRAQSPRWGVRMAPPVWHGMGRRARVRSIGPCGRAPCAGARLSGAISPRAPSVATRARPTTPAATVAAPNVMARRQPHGSPLESGKSLSPPTAR